jgi:hypothetical protein
MVRMMVFVSAAAPPPEEDRPGQNEQSDNTYCTEDKQTFTRGRIRHAPGLQYGVSRFVGQQNGDGAHGEESFFWRGVVSSSPSAPVAIFKRCIR